MIIKALDTKPLRSQATRDRILDAARAVFARQGYERSTIRAIAAEASINPAMVMRYYGNKEGLFTAATEFKPDLAATYADVPRARLGVAVVESILANWQDPAHRNIRSAILLASLTSENARAKYGSQFSEAYLKVLARYGEFGNAREVVALMSTQIIGFLISRYILGSAALVALPNDTVVRSVGAALQTYIDRLE